MSHDLRDLTVFEDLRGDSKSPESLKTCIERIWIDLFDLKSVCGDDNFFQLGGDSLLAVKLAASLNARLRIHLHVVDIFQRPTIDELVDFVIGMNLRGEDESDTGIVEILV
jgi:acyl carrier protein